MAPLNSRDTPSGPRSASSLKGLSMPRIRIAYVAALWSVITLGAVAHVIAEDEPLGRVESVPASASIAQADIGHRMDALGNRYRMWVDR